MNNTGTYKFIDGKFVKVSDKIPKLRPFVYFRQESVNGMYMDTLGPEPTWVQSKDHKRQLMKENHCAEY